MHNLMAEVFAASMKVVAGKDAECRFYYFCCVTSFRVCLYFYDTFSVQTSRNESTYGRSYPSICFISETTEHISIKFGISSVYTESCRSNVTSRDRKGKKDIINTNVNMGERDTRNA